MSEAEILQTNDHGAVRILTLNRPDKLNALTSELLSQLQKAFAETGKADGVKVIILTGSGRGFCSGQELEQGGSGALGDTIRRLYNPLITKIRRLEKPIIAAVNGVAAGAGASLALACDFRIVSEKASFIQAFSKIGLIPDSGSTFFMPRLAGPVKGFELMLTGDKLSAQAALACGLVNKVVPEADVLSAALDLAEQLAHGPVKAYGLIKRAFNQVVFPDLEELLEQEAQLQEAAGRTSDFKEGVQAFLEKRPPVYRGR